MKVNPFVMPIVLIVAMFTITLGAQATGNWTTSGRTAIDVTNFTAADLKGWMTLQQVIDGMKITREEFYSVAGFPADTPLTNALKDMESVISVTDLRTKLTAIYGGASTAPSAMPAMATPTPAPTKVPATPVNKGTPQTTDGTHPTPTPLPVGQVLPADQIKGKMTLKEVSDQCAVPLAKVLEGLKLPANTDPNTAIKDLISQTKIADVTDVINVVTPLQKK